METLDYSVYRSLYFFKKSKLGGQAKDEMGSELGIVDSARKGSARISSMVALLLGSS